MKKRPRVPILPVRTSRSNETTLDVSSSEPNSSVYSVHPNYREAHPSSRGETGNGGVWVNEVFLRETGRRGVGKRDDTGKLALLAQQVPNAYDISIGVSFMGRFAPGSYIIRNKDVLRDDHLPKKLEERKDELDRYAEMLSPVINDWQPNNIFLYGRTGVGKTVATHSLLNELLDDVRGYGALNVNVVELNCTGLTSSYQVAVGLVNEFRNPEHTMTTVDVDRDPLPETGHPQARIMSELRSDITDVGGTILIILDEIDHIGSEDDILYELPRARSNYDLDAKLGIIGITNDLKFREKLDPRVKDTLCEEELHFPPYDANELRSILQRRAEQALHEGVYDGAVINLCAAYAARDRGSARQALDLLRKAADFAEVDAKDSNGERVEILEEHVERAEQVLEQEQVMMGMRELTHHGKLVLLTVARLAAKGQTPERTKQIYQAYTEVAREQGADPLKRRAVHDHLADLTLYGILSQVNVSAGRGNKNHYDLDVSLQSVLEVLDNDLDVNSTRRASQL